MELRYIKYPNSINPLELETGAATEMLPILHYVLLNYSRLIAEYINSQGFDLLMKSDFNFI